MEQDFKRMKVYQLAFQLAMEIFQMTKHFPKAEVYSLTDQIRRSSRSVTAQLAEAYRKRLYPKQYIFKISDADAENAETQVWLDYSLECGYITKEKHQELTQKAIEVGKLIGHIMKNIEKYTGQGR